MRPLKRLTLKTIALTVVFSILFELGSPTVAYALTSGPTQPEAAQFQPVGVNDMVDLFTGDFGYNIPLLELPGPNGGYPFNLSYQSGTTMDQEASWVGLGWNVNPGAIVRNMRGLPDEFNGESDAVERVMDLKANETYGGNVSFGMELGGGNYAVGAIPQGTSVGFSMSFRVYDNSYRGIGFGLDQGASFSKKNSGGLTSGIGFNLSIDTQEGVGANINATLSKESERNPSVYESRTMTKKMSLGIGFHSNGGLNGSISGSITKNQNLHNTQIGKNSEGQLAAYRTSGLRGTNGNTINGSSSISFSSPSHTPSIGMEMKSMNFSAQVGIGIGSNGIYPHIGAGGFYSISKVAKTTESLPAYGYLNLQNEGADEQHAMSDFNREKDGVVYKESKNLASPSLTYDYYVINGQGIGGMYRPYRQEYGHVHEQARKSTGAGGAFGFDVGIPGKYGINGAFNYSKSWSEDWKANNAANSLFKFHGKGYDSPSSTDQDELYEGAYFRLVGDMAAIPVTELDNIGKDAPVKLKNNQHKLEATLKEGAVSNGLVSLEPSYSLNLNMMSRQSRIPRAVSIVPYTNEQMMIKSGGKVTTEVLPEYNIKVYQLFDGQPITKTKLEQNPSVPYNSLAGSRGKDEENKMKNGNHLAGKTIIQPDGKRYVYALPAYNNKQIDESFSVTEHSSSTISVELSGSIETPKYKYDSPTDEFREKVTLPKYAHSYLLTAVLGDDYVDADNIPGPSDGDYGYWVKFNYVQTAKAYGWRTPFYGCSYNPGNRGLSTDDRASYSYGEKEIWYLASAETATHIVYFEMTPRQDGLGAVGPLYQVHFLASNSRDELHKPYRLNRIKLYSKQELAVDNANTLPLQTVHFEYDYSLCQGTTNSKAGGKLTLRKVFFTYRNDRSGELSPYVFEYDEDNNPNYDLIHNRYDRWGTYRSYNYGNDMVNQQFPYTPQFDPNETQSRQNKESFEVERDKDASAWHLKAIRLPSGGKINVEYESDDYAYVQHKKATQMFRMEGIGSGPDGNNKDNTLFDDGDTHWGSQYSPSNNTDKENSFNDRRVYFRLEEPIPTSYGAAQRNQLIKERYLDCAQNKTTKKYDKPIFAKFKSKLRGNIEDYISGYFYLQLDNDTTPYCGVDESNVSTIDGNTYYEYAYVVLDFVDIDGSVYYHPLAVAAWQYMRINLPRVLTGMGEFQASPNENEIVTRIASLGSWINTIRTMFTGYRKYCFEKEFSKHIDLNESYIRLTSPDRIKYGGGSRVKKIYVEDDPIWGNDQIGQTYDYRIREGNARTGRWISSGVASYEPVIGGEENVLRSAEKYTQRIPFFTNNNLFFELPVNESYYPAPRVGYSQVTVSSLNTKKVNDKIGNNDPASSYAGIQTTGKTVHEFYTAKEFPVIARQTDLDPYGKPTVIPLPFIGMIQISKLTASQGYSIKLNDMHGKPKSVKTYASKETGGFEDEPISSVKYMYKCNPKIVDGEQAYELVNKVDVLKNDPQLIGNDGTSATVESMLIGYEYDFFADFRKSVDESGTGGLAFNMEIMGGGPIQFPLPFPWPSFSFNHTSTRLAVTNKIIHQAGILEEVVATDGQSTVSTKNLVFDRYTGEALLTSVNNNYDNKIYAYQYPAYMAYDGTGNASENILMEFTGRLVSAGEKGWELEHENLTLSTPFYGSGNNAGMGATITSLSNPATQITYDKLFGLLNEGDEFIVEFFNSALTNSNQYIYSPSGAKKWMTLYDKKAGTNEHDCSELKSMYFQFNEPGGSYIKSYIPVRMMLSRSGKRNLLNMKVGSISSLKASDNAVELENTPLAQRVKTYNAGSDAPFLYDSLTSQVSRFLNQIVDCGGQFPAGVYYLDSPRFLKADGSLKYPELFGLVKSITLFDNCGWKKHCLKHETVPVPENDQLSISCGGSCYVPPTVVHEAEDEYDTPEVQGGGCNTGNVSQAMILLAIDHWINLQKANGLSNAQIADLWNTTPIHDNYSGFAASSCFTINYTPTRPNCIKEECADCSTALGKLKNGKKAWRGYHLSLNFREQIATQVGKNCIIAHCIARSKYSTGTNTWARTKIDHVEYVSPGNIKIHYVPGYNNTSTSDFCFGEYNFKLPSTYFSIKNVIAASAIELSPYKLDEENYAYPNCVMIDNVMIDANAMPFNLYRWGYKGIWRPYKTHYYNDERYQGTKPGSSEHMTSMLDLATDGVYDGDKSGSTYNKNFYLFNWSSFLLKKVHPKWLANETVTAFTRNSQGSEARDALGLYSAVAYDRKGYLPVAVGKNMKANEMVYENFENTEVIAWLPNEDVNGDGAPEKDQCQIIGVSLSGKRALSTKIGQNHFVMYKFPRTQFDPQAGKKYLISLWVGGYNVLHSPSEIDAKYSHLMNVVLIFKDAAGNVIQNSGGFSQLRFKPKGKIYEGNGTFWRKIEETFVVPEGTKSVTIGFGSTGFSSPGNVPYGTMYNLVGSQIFIDQRACFDDLRIHPADGLMNTYVYDMYDYRLLAQSDENNFPTYYGYSPSGALRVVKKLTENGIKTLKEIQSNTKRVGGISDELEGDGDYDDE